MTLAIPYRNHSTTFDLISLYHCIYITGTLPYMMVVIIFTFYSSFRINLHLTFHCLRPVLFDRWRDGCLLWDPHNDRRCTCCFHFGLCGWFGRGSSGSPCDRWWDYFSRSLHCARGEGSWEGRHFVFGHLLIGRQLQMQEKWTILMYEEVTKDSFFFFCWCRCKSWRLYGNRIDRNTRISLIHGRVCNSREETDNQRDTVNPTCFTEARQVLARYHYN